MTGHQKRPRVLILSYSFSGQTSGLINHLQDGLKGEGIDVLQEKLKPVESLRFPVGSIFSTIKMMLTTFLRFRIPIRDLDEQCLGDFDLIILAGPTWSYNPSGPVLSLIDRYGRTLLAGSKIIPLISCRGYWRMHWWGLKRKLVACGAELPNRIVFSHPCPEPWRTMGVFLKIAGKAPERTRILGKHYSRYGHSKEQYQEAEGFGRLIGRALLQKKPLSALPFQTDIALP